MIRKAGVVLVALVIGALLPVSSSGAVEVVKDGGFESTPAGEDNPNWDEFWVAFPPICSVEVCGDGGGTAGPYKGSNWAWFGGALSPETQSISQEVTIPAGFATLTFWLWIGNVSAGNPEDDVLSVFLGDEELISIAEDAPGYSSYRQVSLDVTPHANTGPLDLVFEFTGFGVTAEGPTNMSVDDISLQSVVPVPKTVKLKGPKSGSPGDKVKLTAIVAPCAGHEGHVVELYRGKKKVASRPSDASCRARFTVKLPKTSTFRAVSPKQDADHLAGTSKKKRVRAE